VPAAALLLLLLLLPKDKRTFLSPLHWSDKNICLNILGRKKEAGTGRRDTLSMMIGKQAQQA